MLKYEVLGTGQHFIHGTLAGSVRKVKNYAHRAKNMKIGTVVPWTITKQKTKISNFP